MRSKNGISCVRLPQICVTDCLQLSGQAIIMDWMTANKWGSMNNLGQEKDWISIFLLRIQSCKGICTFQYGGHCVFGLVDNSTFKIIACEGVDNLSFGLQPEHSLWSTNKPIYCRRKSKSYRRQGVLREIGIKIDMIMSLLHSDMLLSASLFFPGHAFGHYWMCKKG